MSIARFTGPLTADKISEWMSKCEEIFKKFDDAHPTQKMPSRRKIQEAVACLSDSHAASKALSKWYTQNRDTLDTEDWDTFRDELLKHALSTADAFGPLQDLIDAGLYITSGLLGAWLTTSGGSSFSALDYLPRSSVSVESVTCIRCWYNDFSKMPQIQLFEVTIGGSTKKTPVTYYDAKTYVDINLAAGEHLIEMTMTRGGTVSGITYCAFKTSFDKGYSIGESTGERMTVTSPKGWQIVGFYGEASSAIYGPSTSGKYRYPISKLGVIMAPIL